MPIPAIIGAAAPYALSAGAGLLAGALGNQGLGGSQGRSQNFNTFTKPQQGVQNNVLQQVNPLLQKTTQQGFDFGPIAQRARTQFNQQTIPSLAERFTGLNAQGSSAFTQALGQAGAGLDEGLAALESQYGLQQQGMNQNLLSSLLHYGLQPSFQSSYFPRQPGFLEGIAPSLGQGASQAGTFALLKYLGYLA